MSRHNSSHRDRERSPCRRSSSSQDSSDSSAQSNPKSKLKTSSVDEEQSERDRRRREMRQHSRNDSNGANDLPNSSVSMTTGSKPVLSIQMKLNPKPMASIPKTTMLVKPRPVAKSVASAFSNDSDDEVEEMPAECRMRMRNIGRDTPTSSGPNSFGKTKQGFVDVKKIFEKQLKNMTEND